jgi:hypothetical protein
MTWLWLDRITAWQWIAVTLIIDVAVAIGLWVTR